MILLQDMNAGANGDGPYKARPINNFEVRIKQLLLLLRHLVDHVINFGSLAIQLILHHPLQGVWNLLRFFKGLAPNEHLLFEIKGNSWKTRDRSADGKRQSVIEEVHQVLIEVGAAFPEEWLVDFVLHFQECQSFPRCSSVVLDVESVSVVRRVVEDADDAPVSSSLDLVCLMRCGYNNLICHNVNRYEIQLGLWNLL